jgi:CubicO group peptidase (beta-lactamase class C family)
MASKPGSEWIYCSGASHLLSVFLQKATGMDARSYANQYLLAALDIQQVSERDWGSDPQGATNGIAGLYLTPRDLAQYAFLYLDSGHWDGRQVVPADWVKESTRKQAYIGKMNTWVVLIAGLDTCGQSFLIKNIMVIWAEVGRSYLSFHRETS